MLSYRVAGHAFLRGLNDFIFPFVSHFHLPNSLRLSVSNKGGSNVHKAPLSPVPNPLVLGAVGGLGFSHHAYRLLTSTQNISQFPLYIANVHYSSFFPFSVRVFSRPCLRRASRRAHSICPLSERKSSPAQAFIAASTSALIRNGYDFLSGILRRQPSKATLY